MRRIYDITLPLSEHTQVYPGDPKFVLELGADIVNNGYATSIIHLGSHTGTHVDAPAHFIAGARTIDQIDPGILIGPARVIDTGDAQVIQPELLANQLQQVQRVLFKTKYSRLNLWAGSARGSDFAHLSLTTVDYLIQLGVVLVGIDSMSIDSLAASDYPCHQALLNHGVVILEGVDLRAVPAGDYELCCLPLKIVSGEAAPARAILIDPPCYETG